jgi:phage terminase large subunit-like protein
MLEDAMLEGRIRFRRNPVLISAIMSAVVEKDKWDNGWLSKQRSVNKIDAIVAIVMAFGAANALPVAKRKIHLFMVGGPNESAGTNQSTP